MTFAPLSKFAFVLAFVAASSLGCTKWKNSDDQARLLSLELDEAPEKLTTIDTTFGGFVTLLGYKLEAPEQLKPKDKAKITFYWRVNKPVDSGFRLSTRLVSDQGEMLLNADDTGPLRNRRDRKPILPPSTWTVGKVYVDEVTLRLPSKLPGRTANVAVALRKLDQSLAPDHGTADKEGYVVVAKLPLDMRRKAKPVPQVLVPMLESANPVTVDGRLDEKAWKNAALLPNLPNMQNGRPTNVLSTFSGKAKLLWDDRALYLGITVRDPDLNGGFAKDAKEPPVWKRDALELVLKTTETKDNSNYYRIALGLQGILFDSAYDDFESPMSREGLPVGHLDWSSNAQFGIALSGSIDDPTDVDEGYSMELSIPWGSFLKDKEFTARSGSSIWTNFAIYSEGEPLGFVPYYTDRSLQAARCFGKLVLSPADTLVAEPTEIEPLTQELPDRLLNAQAAAAAKLETELEAIKAKKLALAAAAAASAAASAAAAEASALANPGAEAAPPKAKPAE